MVNQTTLAAAFHFSGIGVHSGASAKVIVSPAPADSGFVFARSDLSDQPAIHIKPENTIQTDRNTTIGTSPLNKVMTVEHLLSALWSTGVDNAFIQIDGPEMPIMDGSSLFYCEMIRQAGIEKLGGQRKAITLAAPIFVSHGSSTLAALPSESFKISLMLTNDHNHPALADQFFEWEFNRHDYAEAVAPARTFVFQRELEQLQKLGLIQGAADGMGVLIGLDRVETPLRFSNEMARHKTLDLIGDLVSLGRINMHVLAVRPSHKINSMLCEAVSKEIHYI